MHHFWQRAKALAGENLVSGTVLTGCQTRNPECMQHCGTRSDKEHPLKSDFKAASVVERLSTSLADAEVDYQAGQGIHEFIVRLGGCVTS